MHSKRQIIFFAAILLTSCAAPMPPATVTTIPSPTAAPTATKTPEPIAVVVGYIEQMSEAQQACAEGERGKEMESAYRTNVDYWNTVKFFNGGEIRFQPMMDEAYPDDSGRCVIVMESNSFPGRVFTVPMAQFNRYLETGDPEAMLPPQDADEPQSDMDPFVWDSQATKDSAAAKAGVPLGARWTLWDGEIVYVTGQGEEVKIVGKLDENYQWQVYEAEQVASMAEMDYSLLWEKGAVIEVADYWGAGRAVMTVEDTKGGTEEIRYEEKLLINPESTHSGDFVIERLAFQNLTVEEMSLVSVDLADNEQVADGQLCILRLGTLYNGEQVSFQVVVGGNVFGDLDPERLFESLKRGDSILMEVGIVTGGETNLGYYVGKEYPDTGPERKKKVLFTLLGNGYTEVSKKIVLQTIRNGGVLNGNIGIPVIEPWPF